MLSKQLKSLILPFSAAVIIPVVISSLSHKHLFEPSRTLSVFQLVAGLILILSGLSLLVMTIRLFISIGKGTLAPWDPTKKLVIVGIYRHTRNPMISGVATILLGESIVFNSLGLLIWFATFIAVNHVYFIFSEEVGLVERFGEEYIEYRKNVPRWIPRLRAWKNG